MAPLGRPRDHDRRLAALQNFEFPSLPRLLLIACGAIVAAWLGWSALKTNFYRSAVPPEIGLTWGLATTGSDTDLLTALLPIPPKACGGAIFGLDSATTEAIEKQGLAFFRSATQGRGYTDRGDKLYSYYSYKAWQETPLPDGWISENLLGMWYGLSCMGLGQSVAQGIGTAAGGPGSFYTLGSSKLMMVIPKLWLVVFTYTH